MSRREWLRLAAAGLAVLVAGCGVKGAVQPPPDETPTRFPRQYPREKRPQ